MFQYHLGALILCFLLYDIWHLNMPKTQQEIGKGSYTNKSHKSPNL